MPARLTSSSLLALQSRLHNALESGLRFQEWGSPAEMTKAYTSVKARFDTAGVNQNDRSIGKALLTFLDTGDLSNFIELKYACYGISARVGRQGWCLIEDAERFPAFLRRVDKEMENPRRFRKCYQGLMHSYFSYGIFDDPPESAAVNWQKLQGYLRDRLSVALSASNMPSWLKSLSDHQNLLSDKPCERYSSALLRADTSEVSAATEGVGIAPTSWVWQESMRAHTLAVVKKSDDADYKSYMDPLIDLLDGKGEIALIETIVAECTAQLLIRYTNCKERPEHARLRDLAVNHIGNPWLKRTAWDAYVKNDDARKMVDGWLKRRLITDFFALLSEGGAADRRRLEYWLRFEPVIEDMWFALGSHARGNATKEFREMRRRMEGRLHYLEGSGNTSDNNAFIMRIGNFMVIEFGVTGNACFIFQLSDFKIDFERRFIDINSLKARNHVGRLIHKADWESDFDGWLFKRIGWKPGYVTANTNPVQTPSRAINPSPIQSPGLTIREPFNMGEVERLATRYGLKINDLRRKYGALWVLTHNENQEVNQRLAAMGFRYRAGKGWWKE